MNSDKKEKIMIYTSIVVICIILIITIIFIWKPLFKTVSKNNINKYDKDLTYEDEMSTYYKEYLTENLKITNFDTLYEKLDQNYMNDMIGSTDKEAVKKYLRDNRLISMNITISDISYSKNSITNIFVVKYFVNEEVKTVNIKEKEPFNFSVEFSQSDNMKALLDTINLNKTLDNIKYEVEIVNSKENSINLKLTITNNSEDTYLFDFANLNSLQLKYNENDYINMSMVANSATVNYEITPKSSKSFEALFAIPFADQLSIKGLRFNNVLINGIRSNIEI